MRGRGEERKEEGRREMFCFFLARVAGVVREGEGK